MCYTGITSKSSDTQHQLTKGHAVHLHLIRVPLCHLCDDLCVFPQRVCVLVNIERKQLGVRQQEDESSSDLSHRSEPLEGRVIKLLHDLEGFIHAVIDWVAAVPLCFLKGHRSQSSAGKSTLTFCSDSLLCVWCKSLETWEMHIVLWYLDTNALFLKPKSILILKKKDTESCTKNYFTRTTKIMTNKNKSVYSQTQADILNISVMLYKHTITLLQILCHDISHLVLSVSGSARCNSQSDEICFEITAWSEFTDPVSNQNTLIIFDRHFFEKQWAKKRW